MSQHHFATTRAGVPVTVLLGWDRPLGHFFLVVEKDGDTSDDAYLYSNLNEAKAFELDLEYYMAKLKELGIEVPLTMFEQVSYDAMFNVGNRHVSYAADGTYQEHTDCFEAA